MRTITVALVDSRHADALMPRDGERSGYGAVRFMFDRRHSLYTCKTWEARKSFVDVAPRTAFKTGFPTFEIGRYADFEKPNEPAYLAPSSRAISEMRHADHIVLVMDDSFTERFVTRSLYEQAKTINRHASYGVWRKGSSRKASDRGKWNDIVLGTFGGYGMDDISAPYMHHVFKSAASSVCPRQSHILRIETRTMTPCILDWQRLFSIADVDADPTANGGNRLLPGDSRSEWERFVIRGRHSGWLTPEDRLTDLGRRKVAGIAPELADRTLFERVVQWKGRKLARCMAEIDAYATRFHDIQKSFAAEHGVDLCAL